MLPVPENPVTVPTIREGKVSATIVTTFEIHAMWQNIPTEIKANVSTAPGANPINIFSGITSDTNSNTRFRARIGAKPFFTSLLDQIPPVRLPRSAARKGIHPTSPISKRENSRTSRRYFKVQNMKKWPKASTKNRDMIKPHVSGILRICRHGMPFFTAASSVIVSCPFNI